MTTFQLDSRVWLDRRLDEVFPFFADAFNLERITPPWLRFEVLTPPPIRMRPGSTIDYRLRIRGVPVRWRSRIAVWQPPYRFVDEQVSGPYRLWRHEHRFSEHEGRTLVQDHVDYAPPGGRLVHGLFVERDVRKIFEYRRERLEAIFGRVAEGSRRIPAEAVLEIV